MISDVEKILTQNDNYTRKNPNKKQLRNSEINKLWNLFDNEYKTTDKMECIYRADVSEYEYNKEICTNCKTHLFIGDEGLLICPNKKCGTIYKDCIDYSAEWRYYGADDNQNGDPTRCGMPINQLLQESSYSCKVLLGNKNNSYEMHKIKRYTDWQSMPYKEKSQYDEFELITDISQIAGVPKKIIDKAKYFHKQISEAKTFRGCNRDGIIAASIYVSFRVNDCPRTPKEIAEIFKLDNTSATKGCRNALTIINELQKNNEEEEMINLTKTTPSTFIERYCSKLNMNSELTSLCKFVAKKIETNNYIPENTPHSIAGGIIYFICQICNLNITKLQISNISRISEVTINKCYKKLENYKNELIPKAIINKYNSGN